MQNTRHPRTRQLQTLERWNQMELESARSHHAALVDRRSECECTCQRIESAIADMQSLVREAQQRGAFTVDMLLRQQQFGALKSEELRVATATLQQVQSDCDAAQAVVIQKFRRMSVVKKLRERRVADWDKQSVQMHQKQLDEYGLVRHAHGLGHPENE